MTELFLQSNNKMQLPLCDNFFENVFTMFTELGKHQIQVNLHTFEKTL